MKMLMLEMAPIQWQTNDREMYQFMYHWCNGDDHDTIGEALNRNYYEVILLMLHLDSISALIERPNGIFGFEDHPKREQIADALFKEWQQHAPKVKTEEMRDKLERQEKQESRVAT